MSIKANNAFNEAIQYNLFAEYNGIKKLLAAAKLSKYPEDQYQVARSLVYEYIIERIRKDPNEGDYYEEENIKKLKDAGKILYEKEGMDGMHDKLLWSFVPNRYKRDIDMAWDIY